MSNGGLRDLAPRLQALIDHGLSLGMALDELRRETNSPLEAIRAIRVVTGLDVSSAVEALGGRPAWRGLLARMQGDTEAFFDQD